MVHGGTQYYKLPISLTVGGVVQNPTADAVVFAFRALSDTTDPASLTYSAGDWETASTTYYARRLIGPGSGGLNLAAGTYQVFCKITDNPEAPILDGGLLVLTA